MSYLRVRLQPKIGLLGMVIDPILHGIVEDAYVVPVSIYYDGEPRLHAENDYFLMLSSVFWGSKCLISIDFWSETRCKELLEAQIRGEK